MEIIEMNQQIKNLQLVIGAKDQLIQQMHIVIILLFGLLAIVGVLLYVLFTKYNELQSKNGRYIEVTYFKDWFNGDEVIVPTKLPDSNEQESKQ